MGLNHAVQAELLENDYKYKRLFVQHETLEDQIERENALPAVDTSKLRSLKKKKLFVVDQMTTIEKDSS